MCTAPIQIAAFIPYNNKTMAIRILRFIFLLIWVLAASIYVYPFANNVTDQQALLSFKASITADPFGFLNSWNNSIHFCQWNGVTCNLRRQRVTALNLSSQQLVGTLSSHIGNLSFLREVYLYDNVFHGIIPNEIGRLFRLQYLALTNNFFEGKFPANLSHCVDMRRISVFRNNLEGKLPIELGSWTKLNLFSLGRNRFTGSIPPSIGNLSSLRALNLDYNNLTGVIPLEFAHLAKLEILFATNNSLRGMVPLELYNISSLKEISMDSNDFEGTLPADLGSTLPKLQVYSIADNRISGPLPPSIGNASSLELLEISYNNISGPVPFNLGSLSNLRWLNLGRNPLAHNQPSDDLSFFNSLINCSRLYYLGIYDSGLTGKLPTSIVNLSTTMEKISLYRNQFYGSIPREIGKLVNITSLNLAGNFLTGTIPESVGELSNLVGLYLSDNNITGVIPNSISNITRLGVLSLERNMLQGSMPTGLFNISTLHLLNLRENSLSGVIPEQIGGLPSQLVFLYLHQNLFTGPLPLNIGNLKQLVVLNVSNNKLTGDIPASLGDCVMLEELHMEGNFFEGRIPSSFKALKSLKIVDLSSNHLSENIPRFFDGLHLIVFLNLSHNRLGGEVPKEGPFSNVSRFSVVGNLKLCGGIQALQLPSCPVEILRNKKKTFPYRLILLLVLIPLSILLACFAFIFYRRQKSKQMNFHVPVLQEDQYPRLSYKDLLLATNEFSPNNLLGEGRYGKVYRGVLEQLDQTVAIKVLDVKVRGANKSFLAECEMLRNIRHRNLIKIITTCSSTDFKGNDFKALVYEFMTNGSLDNWLHPSPSYEGSERNLTLLQRLNISIDIAMGLSYLHHHSHTSIIHCDVKPSNILLGEDFVARVGDFGLSRFYIATTLDINQAKMSSTAVYGTVGYVPPEYGIGGKISAEGDVYSYGILLLEMFSGKQPTGGSTLLDNGNNLHDSVKKSLPYRLMDIADPRMLLDQEEHSLTEDNSHNRDAMEVCLTSVFEVGLSCSVATPRERIDMSVAIKKLHVARDKLLHRGQ